MATSTKSRAGIIALAVSGFGLAIKVWDWFTRADQIDPFLGTQKGNALARSVAFVVALALNAPWWVYAAVAVAFGLLWVFAAPDSPARKLRLRPAAAESKEAGRADPTPTPPLPPVTPEKLPLTVPGVPEARAAALSVQLAEFVARRNHFEAHPLGILAPTTQGGPGPLIFPAMLGVTEEAFENGRKYDAQTLALYSTRYAEAVRTTRFAIVNFRAYPDPTKDALILDGPTRVADIKVIAHYLRDLVIAKPPVVSTIAAQNEPDLRRSQPNPQSAVMRPPRPSHGKLTVFVTDENGKALDQAMVSILSEENWAPAPEQMLVTREDGAVAFEAAPRRKFKVLVAHPAYPGEMRDHIECGADVLHIALQPRENVASIILVHSSGTLPNLPLHRFNPHEGGVEGSYAHVTGLSANGVAANPAHFRLNTTVALSGLNGPVVNVRFLEIKGEVSLLDYWWPPHAQAPEPDDTLRTLREVRAHSRADIRRRTEEIVSRISILTGEYHEASFRAEQVAPDLDGPLRDEATRIRRLFVDDLLDPVQRLAAEYARLSVSDDGLDEILNRTSFIRRIPTIDYIQEIEKRLALLPDKLDALE